MFWLETFETPEDLYIKMMIWEIHKTTFHHKDCSFVEEIKTTSVLLVGQCCVLNVPSMPFCQAQSWPQSCFNISTYQTKTKHMQNWRVSQCQRDTHTHNLNKLERSQWNLPITSHLSFFDDDKITSERNHLNGLAIVQAESGDRSILDQQQQQEQQTTSWTKCWDHTNKSSHQ